MSRPPFPRLTMLLVLAVAAAVRLVVAAAPAAPINADEAVTALMAERIRAGEHFPVYFTGQSYNGSLEQYIQAVVFAVFDPTPSSLALRTTQVGLGVATTAAVWLLARRVMPGVWWAVGAATVYAVGPYWSVQLGVRSYGSYDAAQLATTLALGAAFAASGWRLGADRVEMGPRHVGRILWSGAFGLCAGVAVWCGLSSFEVLVVAALWMVPTLVTSWRAAVAAVGAALVGASPAIAWGLAHPDRALVLGGPQPPSTWTSRLNGLYSAVGPKFVGAIQNGEAASALAVLLAIVVLGVWAAAMVVRARGVLDTLTFRQSHRRPADLFVIALPVGIAFYLASSYSWYVDEPRYLLVLYPSTAVAAIATLRWCVLNVVPLNARAGRRPAVVAVTGTLLTGALAGALLASTLAFPKGLASASDEDFRRADRYLASIDLPHAYADYWTALPAAYLGSDRGVAVAPWSDTGAVKSGAVRPRVDHAAQFAYMTSTRGPDRSADLRTAFAAHGIIAEEHHFGGVTVYVTSVTVRPWNLGLT